LITELINRLETEAKNELTLKGACDKMTAENDAKVDEYSTA